MCEDGEQDAIHGGTILEDAHGPGASSYFSEPAFDGIGGAHSLSFFVGTVAQAGEQIVEIG